jgi:tocopherol cyclase
VTHPEATTRTVRRLTDAYRRAGADPPFADPGRDHGAGMEGYYWRIVDSERREVLVVLCGVCRGPAGRWGLVALAAHPGAVARHAIAQPAQGDARRFGVSAGDVLEGSLDHLALRLDGDHWVDATFTPRVVWPRRALGVLGAAHVVPGLAQYWQPLLLDAEVSGEACVAGRRLRLEGAGAYAEKNWGPGFAGRWWWGQAGAFPGAELGVAFAGGRLPLLGAHPAPTAAVVRLDRRVIALQPPLTRTRVAAGRLGWRLTMRSPRYRLELEGEPGGSTPHVLPVPEPGPPGFELRSQQLLAGEIGMRLRSGRRTLIDARSPLAGLEIGAPPA